MLKKVEMYIIIWLGFLSVAIIISTLHIYQIEKLVGLTPEIPKSQIFCKEIYDHNWIEEHCYLPGENENKTFEFENFTIKITPDEEGIFGRYSICLDTENRTEPPKKEVCYRIPIIEQTWEGLTKDS